MDKKEHINNLLEYLLDKGCNLSKYYKEPERYRIEMKGEWVFKIVYSPSNAVHQVFFIKEHLYNNYVRKNKINNLLNNING